MIDLDGRICCTAVVTVVQLNACTITALLTLSESIILDLHSHIASGNITISTHHRLLVSDKVRRQKGE